MPYSATYRSTLHRDVSDALNIAADAPDEVKRWGIGVLAGGIMPGQHLGANAWQDADGTLNRLKEVYRTGSMEAMFTEGFRESERLLKEGNWDELERLGKGSGSIWRKLDPVEPGRIASLLDDPDREEFERLRRVREEHTGADADPRAINRYNELVAEGTKRDRAMRYVEKQRQENAFAMLAAITPDLTPEAMGVIERAVANDYRIADEDEGAFLTEEKGGLPRSQKELVAAYLGYCKPTHGAGAWGQFMQRMWEQAWDVTRHTGEEISDLFNLAMHRSFRRGGYREVLEQRAYLQQINQKNFADLGFWGNSFAEAGGILGYWTPMIASLFLTKGVGSLAGVKAAGAAGSIARGVGMAGRVAGPMVSHGMFVSDFRQQFLQRIALDGGDPTALGTQAAAWIGAIAADAVEHIAWGQMVGKTGMAEVQSQAYSKLVHSAAARFGKKMGVEFGKMGLGEAAVHVLAERGITTVFEAVEEALQQAIEEVVVDIGDGRTVRLGNLLEQSYGAFKATLGPMMLTALNPFAMAGRARSAVTMRNLDGDAIDRMMSSGERLKQLAAEGRLVRSDEDMGVLGGLMRMTAQAATEEDAQRALLERGFSAGQANTMLRTFAAIRRSAIEHGQTGELGPAMLQADEELARAGFSLSENPDGTTTATRIQTDGQGNKRRQTLKIAWGAFRELDMTSPAEVGSALDYIRQNASEGTKTTLRTLGLDIARPNVEIMADAAAMNALGLYVAENELGDVANSLATGTTKSKEADGTEIDEDTYTITLTEKATRESIWHEVGHAAGYALRRMGLSEEEIDAIQNWRSGEDGKAPSEADMALPEHAGAGGTEFYGEERVNYELAGEIARKNEPKTAFARGLEYVGDLVRNVLRIRKKAEEDGNAAAIMTELIWHGHLGKLDTLNDAQKRVLLEARRRRQAAETGGEAPPSPEGPSSAGEGPSSAAEGTKPATSVRPPDERTVANFCFDRPILRDDMARLAASGELSEDDIFETGYRWSPFLRAWVVQPELKGQKFTPNGRYMGLDGEWHGEEARAMVASAAQHSISALEDIAAGKEYGILHNAMYGEIRYPLGKLGRIRKNGKTKGGLGLLHIVSERMRKDGATVEEAIETALRVGIAAEIGEETARIENTRWLDFDGTRAIIALTENGNPIITGYEINADETPAAFPSSEALPRQPLMREADIVAALKERLARKRQNVNSEVDEESGFRRMYAAAQNLPSPEFAMDGTIVDALPAHLREDARAIVAERGGTAAWMVEVDGTPTELNEREWLRREAERRHGERRYAFGGIYSGGTGDYANKSRVGGVGDGPSLRYVGTGDGSAAFGYGLYGSTGRNVAESYAEKGVESKLIGSVGKFELLHNGEPLHWTEKQSIKYNAHMGSNGDEKSIALYYLSKTGSVKKAIAAIVREDKEAEKSGFALHRWEGGGRHRYADAIRWLNEHGKEYKCRKVKGFVYERTFFTNRATPAETERHLLHWYEELPNEQFEWIKEALKSTNIDLEISYGGGIKHFKFVRGDEVFRSESNHRDYSVSIFGANVYGAATCAAMYKALEVVLGTQKAASELLVKAGLDGIKYPIGSIHGKTQEGFNLVSFRDDNIRVDHKWVDGEQRYQIAGALGAGRLENRRLADAEEMERSGATREDIWRETGWWRGADGKWRVEIADIRLTDDWKEKVKAGCQLRDVMSGPVIDAYDNAIGGVWISVDKSLKMTSTAGVFNIRLGTIRLSPEQTKSKSGFLQTLAHEVQHTIQKEEEFERGTSLSWQMDVRERQIDMTGFPKAWWEYERRNREFSTALSSFVQSIAEPWLRYVHDASIDGKGRVKFPYETKDEIPRLNGRMIRSLADIAKGVEKKLNKWKFYDVGSLARNGDLADVLRRIGADDLGWFLSDSLKESFGEEYTKWAANAQESYLAMASEAAAKIAEADAVVKEISRPLDNAFADAKNAYNNAGGEVEARMVEARLGLSEEQRKEIPPWITEAVVRQDTFTKRSDYSYSAQREMMDRMAGRRHAVAPAGEQKQAGTAYPDAGGEIGDRRFAVGARKMTTAEVERVVRIFGTTTDARNVAFVTPDGKWLDYDQMGEHWEISQALNPGHEAQLRAMKEFEGDAWPYVDAALKAGLVRASQWPRTMDGRLQEMSIQFGTQPTGACLNSVIKMLEQCADIEGGRLGVTVEYDGEGGRWWRKYERDDLKTCIRHLKAFGQTGKAPARSMSVRGGEEGEARYMVSPTLASDVAEALEKDGAGHYKKSAGAGIRYATSLPIMDFLGIRMNGIFTTADRIRKMVTKHFLTPDQVRSLAEESDHPAAVFTNVDGKGSHVILTEIMAPSKENGQQKPVMVLLRPEKGGSGGYIASAYSRRAETESAYISWRRHLRYIDKEKIAGLGLEGETDSQLEPQASGNQVLTPLDYSRWSTSGSQAYAGTDGKSESGARPAVGGRIREYDREAPYSPRGQLAALATMYLIQGKEPDRGNLQQIKERLGEQGDVDAIIAEAKETHGRILEDLKAKGRKASAGEIAREAARRTKAAHPEDLLEEAYKRGAAAGTWAQGARGAVLSTLIDESRSDSYHDFALEMGLDIAGIYHRFTLQQARKEEAAGRGKGTESEEEGADQALENAVGFAEGAQGPLDPNSEAGRSLSELETRQQENIERALREADMDWEERNRLREERRQRRLEREREAEAAGEGSGDGEGGGGEAVEDVPEGMDENDLAVDILERNRVDIRDPWKFALFLRKAIRNRILKANGLPVDFATLDEALAAEERLWQNPTNVAQFAKSMAAILRDMAGRLMDHEGDTYPAVLVKLEQLSRMQNVRAIEIQAAFEIATIARRSIRETTGKMVEQTRTRLQKSYIGKHRFGEHDELEEDLKRKITGHVRRMAIWYKRVLGLTEGGIERERDKLLDRLSERNRALDEASAQGVSAAKADEDAVAAETLWKLKALDTYGGTRYLLPGEARERLVEMERWMATEGLKQAARIEEASRRYEKDRETIIKGCTVRDPATGEERTHEEDSKLDRFWRMTVNTINQRFRLLFARASGQEGAAARELAERDSLRISQGTTRYEREKQEMRRALRDTVREVVGPRGVRAWVKHLQEEIPEEHSRALSKQGYRHLTYGQVMHLYGYLRQTATYGDNISRHGRVGQRVYIERHVLTAEDIKILNGMMRIYAERREALDAASRDITGFEMKSPDPWYMPVKIKTPTRSGLETVVSTVDAMPAVFSERRKHQLDVDEKADIMVMFNDRMEQSARVLGLGRTGLDVIHTWGSADVKDAITKARGKKFTTALVNHLTDWMNGGRPRLQNRAGEDERFLNGLRTVGTYTALWGNVLSGLKQTLSSPVFALAREVGERSIFQDMREFRSDAWKQAWRELAESDPYKARYGDVGVMEETKEAVQGGNMTGRLEAVLRAGMKPIELGDKTPGIIVGVGMYMAARDRMVDSGMDPVEAKRKAADLTMQAVEWTQQSGRTENQPEYARRGSSTTRLLMMFASSPMLQAGWEVQRIVEYREKREAFGKDSKEARDAATALRNAIIINHVVMPLAFQIASWGFQALLGRPPEEEDLPELLYACAIGPYSRLLVLSGLAHAAWNAAMGRSTYGRWNTVPSALVNLEQDVIDAVRLPIDLATWKPEEAWKDIDRFLRRNISIYRHGRTAWHNWAEAE